MKGDIKFLGAAASALNMQELTAYVSKCVESNSDRAIIANHNLHSIYVFRRDATMQKFYEASAICHFDGMGAVWIARLLGSRVNTEQRVTYVDWIWSLMERASKADWRVFFLGGRPGVADLAKDVLMRRFGSLRFAGHDGFFDMNIESADNRAVVQQIRAFRPNVLIVGMGMPRQERWILENLDQIRANVILQAGACMDFVAGIAPTPPRWMGRAGIEWLYRLGCEPARLGARYLVEPWFVAYWVARALVRGEHSRRARKATRQ